jgi:hypothetical protein
MSFRAMGFLSLPLDEQNSLLLIQLRDPDNYIVPVMQWIAE